MEKLLLVILAIIWAGTNLGLIARDENMNLKGLRVDREGASIKKLVKVDLEENSILGISSA